MPALLGFLILGPQQAAVQGVEKEKHLGMLKGIAKEKGGINKQIKRAQENQRNERRKVSREKSQVIVYYYK